MVIECFSEFLETDEVRLSDTFVDESITVLANYMYKDKWNILDFV